MQNFIKKDIEKTQAIISNILNDLDLLEAVENIAIKAIEIYKNGGKILFAGNGGSAADAQHLSAELVSRFHFDRPALPAIALTTDTSALTAIGNDYGYKQIFSRQVEAIGQKGDMLIAISTSGNSENIIEALKIAKEKEIITVGFTGKTSGAMAKLCNMILQIPSTETPKIQECHILLGHIICSIIEREMFKNK